MAAWDLDPWGNDLAADWFAAFFKGVKANARIRPAFQDRNEDCLAARVLQEVHNKLTTGLKNPRSPHRRTQ
jgi:hypothetical protein